MNKTILVCGHGPGISDAVARRFGRAGYRVAIVARNAERLAEAEKKLAAEGIEAKSFAVDLGNADAVRALVRDVRASLGPIAVVHWNAYGGGASDLMTASVAELHAVFDISTVGLIVATQEALGDLKAQKGAVLVTGGGFAFYDPKVDAMASSYGASGLAIAKASQHKTVGLLRERLGREDVYVGEVVVLGLVKGTAFDNGGATLEPSDIADKFYELFDKRAEWSVNFPG